VPKAPAKKTDQTGSFAAATFSCHSHIEDGITAPVVAILRGE